MRALVPALKAFRTDRSGNFAITAGLSATILIAAIGGGTDFAMQLWVKAVAQRAADAAALAGAKELEFGTVTTAKARIQAIAAANVPASIKSLTFADTIDKAAGTVSVTGSANLTPNFLQLAAITKLPVSATAVASIMQKQYTDFYFLLDVSESMNIAASEADRLKLERITTKVNNRPCAFACHEVEPGWSLLSVYQMNQRSSEGPARLRIDVARDASDSMIDKLLAYNGTSDSLKSMRVSTAGFSVGFEKGVEKSKNAKALKDSLRNFSLASNHTNYPNAFGQFTSMLGLQGNGRSEDTPLKMALVLTDGVKDLWFDNVGLGPLDPSLCQTIKAKGITLAVLEIKYVARYGEQFFNERVASYYPSISPSLKDCASKGYYFLATDADQAEAQLIAATDALLATQRRLLK